MTTTLRIADVVRYAFAGREKTRWRITSFLVRVEDTFEAKHACEFDDVMEEINNRIINRHLLKEQYQRQERGLPAGRRFRYRWCTREEATHVELVAVCGAIAPIEDCEVVGEVAWDREMIDKERADYEKFPLLGRLTDWQWENRP